MVPLAADQQRGEHPLAMSGRACDELSTKSRSTILAFLSAECLRLSAVSMSPMRA